MLMINSKQPRELLNAIKSDCSEGRYPEWSVNEHGHVRHASTETGWRNDWALRFVLRAGFITAECIPDDPSLRDIAGSCPTLQGRFLELLITNYHRLFQTATYSYLA